MLLSPISQQKQLLSNRSSNIPEIPSEYKVAGLQVNRPMSGVKRVDSIK